jgi:hypothetical protein
LDRGRGETGSGESEVAMNQLVTLGFVVLLVALVIVLDASLALRAIDQLAQAEDFAEIQSVTSVTNGPIRF